MGVVAIASIHSCPVDAQTRSDDKFATGATLREVLAAWGEPDERIERSVKRELVWNYKGGALVVFKDGQVISLKAGTTDSQLQAKKGCKRVD